MPSLPEVLTVREARATAAALSQAMRGEAAGPVTVDASGLKRFDSAALAVLIACRREAAAVGRDFSVRGAPPLLTELATLYGVETLLAPVAA